MPHQDHMLAIGKTKIRRCCSSRQHPVNYHKLTGLTASRVNSNSSLILASSLHHLPRKDYAILLTTSSHQPLSPSLFAHWTGATYSTADTVTFPLTLSTTWTAPKHALTVHQTQLLPPLMALPAWRLGEYALIHLPILH